MTADVSGVVTVQAPAKINLYLHVTGRREDGYHVLDSLVAFTEFGDTLTAESGQGLTFNAKGEHAGDLPGPEKELTVRAAQALAQAAGVDANATLTLTKMLPVASGLGGGSGDAAAALRSLSALWGISDGAVDLPATALALGADIPVCLTRKAMFVGGIGDELTPAPLLPDAGILLVNPGVKLSTRSVFTSRKGGFQPEARFKKAPATAKDLARVLEDRENDLTESAVRLCPVITDVLKALEKLDGCHLARMTGSGATCFGLFDDLEAAAASAAAMRRENWWVKPTRLAQSVR